MVLRIEYLYPSDGKLKLADYAYSSWDNNFIYKPLAEVIPTRDSSRLREECESGIHFFLTSREAKDY